MDNTLRVYERVPDSYDQGIQLRIKSREKGATTSSVRRILKKGGGRNFRKSEKNKNQNKKLFHPNSVRFFAQNQVKSKKKKKKGSSLKLSPIFAQSWVQAYNKRIKHTLCVIQARRQKFAMGGCFRGLGAKPPALENFAFFCKNNFILGLF